MNDEITLEWEEYIKKYIDLLEKSMRERTTLYSEMMALAGKSGTLKTLHSRYMQSKQRDEEDNI